MRETLLDLMIRFNEGNMLDPWNENEEELDDLDDLLGSYRRGTLGSYQSGTAPGVKYVSDAPDGGWVGSYQGKQYTYNVPKPGQQAQPGSGGGGGGLSTGGGGGLSSSTSGTSGSGGGGGFVGGGVGGAPEDTADYLADYGKGLMEPGSDLSKRWMEQMREEVGRGTDAAQRAAAYQAAQSGFGSGASPELLQMQGDIGIAGREAAGDAASDYLLRAPEMGIGAMGGALGSQVGMRGQDLTSKIESERNVLSREGMQFQERQDRGYEDTRQRERDEDIARENERYEEEMRRYDLANELVQEGSTGGYSPPAQQPSYGGGWRLGAR